MVDRKKPTKKTAKTASQKAKLSKTQISEAVEKLKSKAEGYVHDPKKAKKLFEDAAKKTKGFETNHGPLAEFWGYLTALLRLLRAYFRGEYREIPWNSIVLVAVAIIYFVSPFDLIFDFLPGGFLDDAAILAFVVGRIKVDLDNFLAWEMTRAVDADDESAHTE